MKTEESKPYPKNFEELVCNRDFTFLGVHKKRGFDAIKEIGILEDFSGILMHDCFGTYFKLEACEHVLCNPHLLRELVFCHEELSQKWAKSMIDFIWECYEQSQEMNEGVCDIRVWHNRFDQIIRQGYKENPKPKRKRRRKKGERGRVGQSKPLNLLDRLSLHRDKILRFLEDSEIPFSNNLAEQAVRMAKIKQKISGGFRKYESAEIFARIRSFTATAQKHCHSVFDAICSLFKGPAYTFLS